MDKKKDPQITPDDLLKAESAFLKLKLEMEHGMKMQEFSTLNPKIENQWLQSVYAFEQQFKNAGRIRLYDYIGKPSFKKWNTLSTAQMREELDRLRTIMGENSVELDCICEYDDATIYRFLTEELFEYEMDDMRIPGMTCHYTYEEFHPNHDYDLRRETTDFIDSLFTKEWNEDYHAIVLARNVMFLGKEHSLKAVSAIIKVFQEMHGTLQIRSFDITDVTIHSDVLTADVRATLDVRGKKKNGGSVRYTGVCSFRFVRDSQFWQISGFVVPGF